MLQVDQGVTVQSRIKNHDQRYARLLLVLAEEPVRADPGGRGNRTHGRRVGVTKPAEAHDHFTQGIQEQIAVGIIANDRRACIAAGGDVVNRA